MKTLESALEQAAQDPAARPEFYRLLLDADVYVVGTAVGASTGTLAPGEAVSLMSVQRADGARAIAFFTSVAALTRFFTEEQPYLAMPARALFALTRGNTLVLNPGSEFGKEFLPSEISSLLETGLNAVPSVREVDAETPVQLSVPAEQPVAMVQALTRLMQRHAQVRAAYLCLMRLPSPEDDEPSIVVGLEGDGDVFPAIQEASAVLGGITPPGTAVDFLEIKRGEAGIAEYMFASVRPFYERARRGRWREGLRSLFSPPPAAGTH